MSAQQIPVGMDISEAAKGRHRLFAQCLDRLQNFAYRGLNVYSLNNTRFIVVCIVVDSRWRTLVDMLMPNATEAHWQVFRDRDEIPVARGIARFNEALKQLIVSELPELADSFSKPTCDTKANCIVLDDSGGTVYEIDSIEMT